MNSDEIKIIRSNSGLTRFEFAESLGVSIDTLDAWIKGKTKIPIPVSKLIKLLYVDKVEYTHKIPFESIPLVEGTAIGGFWNSKFSIEERDVKVYYIIPKFQHKKVDFMIEVEGSSMYPKYNSGDVVACKIINEKSFIQWNKTHVIATKDQGIIIKRIKEGENGSLVMVSDNKDYDSFRVSMEEIEGIALVVGVIRLE